MKTGFNLLLWTTHVTDEHFPILEDLRRTGYDGVEIPLFEGDPAHYRRLGGVIRDLGLGCTTVCVIPDEARNPISPEPAHREGALDFLKWAIECNQALGSETMAGPFHQPLGVFSGRGATEDERRWGADVHRRAAEVARGAGLMLAIEALNRFECYFLNTVADAAAYARLVGHPNFGTMYDTFHANIEEKDPIGCIAPAIGEIRHVHISENDRGTPGRGHIDFPAAFRALRGAGYDGWFTIEAFGRALPGLAAATRVWRDFFPSREQVYTEGLRVMRDAWAQAAQPAGGRD